MQVKVRSANLEADRVLLIDTHLRYLTPHSNAARFDWLYRHNPHGQGQVWIAYDPTNGAIIGTASAFPRCLSIAGHKEKGWVLGDFCVNESYRSLGPALQLQRACLAAVDTGQMTFCYDFPSTGMMAIYRRLRIEPSGHMLRMAKPLRVDRKLGTLVHYPPVARGLRAMGNTMLALRDITVKDDRAVTISLHDGRCGEEFSTLAHHVSHRYEACIQRSAAYLNWRYLAHPLHQHEVLTARRGGALLAYAVFMQTGEDAALVDLLGVENPTILSSLVKRVIALLRKRGVITVSALMIASHPWRGMLHRLGFKAREASPVMVYASPHSQTKYSLGEGHNWFLMQGDRDS